jgi:hypothetical protein
MQRKSCAGHFSSCCPNDAASACGVAPQPAANPRGTASVAHSGGEGSKPSTAVPVRPPLTGQMHYVGRKCAQAQLTGQAMNRAWGRNGESKRASLQVLQIQRVARSTWEHSLSAARVPPVHYRWALVQLPAARSYFSPPEPPRSTSDRRSEVLRGGSGEAPGATTAVSAGMGPEVGGWAARDGPFGEPTEHAAMLVCLNSARSATIAVYLSKNGAHSRT